MVPVVELAANITAPKGREHIFSSASLFHQWATHFEQQTKSLIVDENRRGWDSVEQTVDVFETEQKHLWYIKTPGMYTSYQRTKRVYNMSDSEVDVHFWRDEVSDE